MTRICEFWFDSSCPYTWITSRWLLEAAAVRPIEVRWRVLSLAALNEGRDDDPEGDPEGYLWLPARICVAVADRYGHEALGRYYTALGARVHRPGEPEWNPETWPDALADAGLPRELADAASDTGLDGAVRAATAEGIGKVGPHIGTPVIAVEGGPAFFGPVLSRVPTGEDAGRLWDGTLLVAGAPGFHELKAAPPAKPAYT
ncbi:MULTISPECIES: disulfide bond formation protein DsbA [Actinomadura]|uniref:Disulfide bond formation protein DsbA n=1 Tax=Actinomadura yumaensis TaxID=111807 RepID=A0ABW2D0V2_9ACTN|nr:disulfide bond formation protein DsbA [Actinomadura sp. J1-007]MWK32664.1 disulfide bond formation protein DsbA [Actinomadura sp. J1-007]